MDHELLDPVRLDLAWLDEPEERADVGMRLAADVLARRRAQGLAEGATVRVDEEVDRLDVAHAEQLGGFHHRALGDVQGTLGEPPVSGVPPHGDVVTGELLPLQARIDDPVRRFRTQDGAVLGDDPEAVGVGGIGYHVATLEDGGLPGVRTGPLHRGDTDALAAVVGQRRQQLHAPWRGGRPERRPEDDGLAEVTRRLRLPEPDGRPVGRLDRRLVGRLDGHLGCHRRAHGRAERQQQRQARTEQALERCSWGHAQRLHSRSA